MLRSLPSIVVLAAWLAPSVVHASASPPTEMLIAADVGVSPNERRKRRLNLRQILHKVMSSFVGWSRDTAHYEPKRPSRQKPHERHFRSPEDPTLDKIPPQESATSTDKDTAAA